MNVKGTAAGGRQRPFNPDDRIFSMGLTGDMNDIMNTHNLAMVALTRRMQHERNYDEQPVQRLTRMQQLDIDPRMELNWIMDFCAQVKR